ncbi:hypothetical protein CK507_12350 [Pseudomonas sp. WN033]|nr:hypothetical protein CK507_12350 [Pseudomonas sp. WN033]
MNKSCGVLALSSALALGATQVQALSLAASAGSNSFGLEATQTLVPGVRAGVGYLKTDDSGRDARLYSGSLMISLPTPLVDLSVGGRYQYQDTDYGNGGGLGLGGSLFVDTPLPRVSLGGYGFYTPEGLTHGNVNESYEYGAQVRAKLFAQSYAYAGYRYLRTDFDRRGNRTLHSGPVLGVSVGF